MKNLKRIVALALAFVMTFTLSFAFNDAESIGIDYVDDMNMLVQLGVINGYTDGSFKPQESVSRAEFAKMAYTLKYGYDDQGKLFGGSASAFVDVANNHWAKGYINYCANQKIVSGIGGGKFNPNGNVTVAEAAKMLLVILGCNAQTEGLVGVNWQGNTVAKAIELGVFDGWVGDPTAPASRELICKLMRNTVFAPVYIYSPITGVGSQKKVLEPSEDNITLGEQTMGLKHITGIVVANEFYGINVLDNDKEVIKASATNDEDKSIVAYENEEGKWVTEDINVGLSEEVLGSLVDVYYAYNKNTRQDEVIGDVLINSNTVVYEVPASEIDIYPNGEETRSKKEIKPYIAFGDVEIAAPAGTKRVSEAEKYTGDAFDFLMYNEDYVQDATAKADMGRGVLSTYRVVSIDGGKNVSYIFNTKKATLTSVTSYSESKGTIGLRGHGTIELDDAIVYDGIRKGDNVIVYEFDGKTVVEPTETITGIATSWFKNTVEIDGETYTGSDAFLNKNEVKSLSEYFSKMVRRNASYIIYNGMILDVDSDADVAVDVSDYAVVLKSEYDEKTGDAIVRLGMTDGTDESYVVSYYVDDKNEAHDAEDVDLEEYFVDNKLFGNIVSYVVSKGKAEITLESAFTTGGYEVKDEGIVIDGTSYWSGNSSVLFLLYTNGDASRNVRFKTYKLADMSDRATAAIPVYKAEKEMINGGAFITKDNDILLGAITYGTEVPGLLSEGEDFGYIANSVVVYDVATRKNYLDMTVIGEDGAMTGYFKEFRAAEISGLTAGEDVTSGKYAIGNIVSYSYDGANFSAIDDISNEFIEVCVVDVASARISYYINDALETTKIDEYRFDVIAIMDDDYIGTEIYEGDEDEIINNAYIQIEDDKIVRVISIHE